MLTYLHGQFAVPFNFSKLAICITLLRFKDINQKSVYHYSPTLNMSSVPLERIKQTMKSQLLSSPKFMNVGYYPSEANCNKGRSQNRYFFRVDTPICFTVLRLLRKSISKTTNRFVPGEMSRTEKLKT